MVMSIISRPLTLRALVPVLALALATSSCGRGRKIPGLDGFQAGVIQQRLYVSFVSTTLEWDVGATFPVPGLEDSQLSIAPDLELRRNGLPIFGPDRVVTQ